MQISKNYIASLIPKGSMILDVGSFNGKDAAELAEACQSDVHCFEPYPASFEAIKLLRNDRLIQWPYALGAFNGTVPMYIAKSHVQSNSIREPKKHKKIWPEIKFRQKVFVKITTLDSWFASWQAQDPECKGIEFIWCDVNGSELDFLIGGAETLNVTKYLYIEYCAIELYKDAMTKEATIKALPGFEAIGEYNTGPSYGNLLFKSKNADLWTR